MKLQILFKSLPIAFIAFFTVATLSAQEAAPVKKVKPATKETLEANEARADEEVAKELNLTPEQKVAFKKANENYKTKSKAVKNGKKEDMQRLREERIRAHKAALSPDQLKKYDEIQARKDARRKEKQAYKSQKKGEKSVKKAEIKTQKAENKEIKKELKKQ